MLDRPRTSRLGWALACLLLFGLIAVSVQQDWSWIVDVDHRGRSAREWALDDRGLRGALLVVEDLFATVGMTVYTCLLAAGLWAKNHRRAAVFVVGVMLATSLLTTGAKLLFGRARPEWQDLEELLDSKSFPSGHASSAAALAGIVVVLVVMLVRRGAIRRLLSGVAVLLAVAVALDRVLLGRHYPSDVVAGALLGTAVVLVGLVVYSPLPVSHALGSEPLPQALPSSKRLAVVLNPIKVEDVEVFKTTVIAMARAAGWRDPTWHLTTPEDSGTGQAEEASVAGADLVIVCGGDGTVREVAAELAGTGIPVGIIPAGTGNLLARNLDIPLYIRAAIDIALTGQDRAIDMVAVTGDRPADPHGEVVDEDADGVPERFESHFMVMAGMGFDAAIMEGVNEDIKKKVGWLAYVLSALKSLMFPVTRVEISIDGADYTKHRARTIVVGNVGYLQAGMPLLPDAAIDDGQLDVVLLYPRRFLSWIPLAVRVLAKRSRTDDTINRMTGRTVSIRASVDTPRQLDGDSIGPGRELHMECIHGRLLVRVPR
ncbi:diacylglycerol kinase family protein [Nocardioides sp.]|uniref:diacylglycerol kinase family protein n=1 Tax=Nocardioides sp. TaxID=35761 RepID=UPI002724F5C8|nr:diacylglycerol kinase family protein [Nocardioides sp.]MDO9456113.1 diacylglycerol kinase family protein [Nocardioides sp.]